MIAPPLLVSFCSVKDYSSAIVDDMAIELDAFTHLVDKSLPPVVSSRSLALLFGFSPKLLNAIASNNKKYYREFTIRTKNKQRKIHAPKVVLKVIQKWFGYHLAEALPVSEHVFGFVAGRSAAMAAAKHCNAEWVYSIDIENFFPSTTYDVIVTALAEVGYPPKGGNLIAQLSCYGKYLAQGAPSSPAISNLVMQKIDSELVELANSHGCRFTRYADDIVFSGVGAFPEELRDQIKRLFDGTCWVLSSTKCKLSELHKGQRLKVHGLLVHGATPRLTKGYRNKIRAYRHLLLQNKVGDDDLNRLNGHVNYAQSIDKIDE